VIGKFSRDSFSGIAQYKAMPKDMQLPVGLWQSSLLFVDALSLKLSNTPQMSIISCPFCGCQLTLPEGVQTIRVINCCLNRFVSALITSDICHHLIQMGHRNPIEYPKLKGCLKSSAKREFIRKSYHRLDFENTKNRYHLIRYGSFVMASIFCVCVVSPSRLTLRPSNSML
jgi:hypothetical protein